VAETCQGDSEQSGTYREGGLRGAVSGAGVHLTAPRDLGRYGQRRAFKHPAQNARHQLVTDYRVNRPRTDCQVPWAVNLYQGAKPRGLVDQGLRGLRCLASAAVSGDLWRVMCVASPA